MQTENQGCYTQVDDDNKRSYNNFSQENYLFKNKRRPTMEQMPYIFKMTTSDQNSPLLPVYDTKIPNIEKIPDKNQKRKKFLLCEIEEQLVEIPNYRNDVEGYDATSFYENIGNLQANIYSLENY